MQSANNLKTNQNLSRASDLNFKGSGRRSYSGQVGESHSDRLYRLRFTQRSSLNLSLTGLKADAELALLSRSGKVLQRSDRAGATSEAIRQTVKRGVYYIQVSSDRGNTQYKLNLAVKAAKQTGGHEQLSTTSSSNNAFIQQVVALTNSYRAQAGLQPLQLNSKLTAAAYRHSRDMALNDFFDHQGSDGSRAGIRIAAQGYRYTMAGENIAAGYTTPAEVVTGWMNSPGHRANILYPTAKEIGVGFYFLANDSGEAPYQYYWTQNFATPKV
jgi:uncharacterized protein YkwD